MKFDIIRHPLGDPGDPLKQRDTIGWKANVNGQYYGAYVVVDRFGVTDEQLRLFASSILFFIDYPENYLLSDGCTPQPLGGKNEQEKD